jgi:sugar phosphate permease
MNIFSKSTTKNLVPSSSNDYIWVVLVITTLSQTTFSFLALGIGSVVPFFISDLGISKAQAGFLVGAVNFGIALTSILMGILADRLGEKKVLIAGGLLTGLTGLIASRVDTFEVLVCMMLIIGCWTASCTPAGSKGIIAWFPLNKRGFAMGFRQIGQPLGGGLAAIILPVIALAYGWRLALLGASLFIIAGSVLVAIIYKEKNVDKGVKKEQVPIKQN